MDKFSRFKVYDTYFYKEAPNSDGRFILVISHSRHATFSRSTDIVSLQEVNAGGAGAR